MSIETSPILSDRKHLVQCIGEYKPTENYIFIESSEVGTMRLPYDARAELDRMRHSLYWSLNAKPIFNFRVGPPEEEVVRVDSWYESRLGEITREEQAFRQRLDSARKSGAIDQSNYMKAVMDLESTTKPFRLARQEASETYHKEIKF